MEHNNFECSLLRGERPLGPNDLEIDELFHVDDDSFTFSLDVIAVEREVFGKCLSCDKDESYVQAYVVYEKATGQVHKTMDVVLVLPHDEEEFYCELLPEVRNALKQKMNDYCQGMYGEKLFEP